MRSTFDRRNVAARLGQDELHEAVASTAAVRQHPLHPMLVPLPIGAIIGLLGADIAYWITLDPFWARAGLWLAGFAAVTGLLAGAAGAVDFMHTEKVRKLTAGWVHAVGNVVVVFLVAASWFLRLGDPNAFVIPGGMLLSLVIVAIAGVTGWLGGELSYRYRVGVIPHRDERS